MLIRRAHRPLRHGLARVLSKRGICSRTQAASWIADGRVSVAGRVVRDPEHPVRPDDATIRIDGLLPALPQRRYLALNKPRGLVTTVADEQGRDTVYRCFEASGEGLAPGWIAPVGRLDKASEGLLLFSNDPAWAAHISDRGTGPDKTYHVQVDAVPSPVVLTRLVEGIQVEGAWLRAVSATLLRAGKKRAWLEVVLDEGRNRQIRRLLAACDLKVLRLVRTAIGPLLLGELGKGQWRELSAAEVAALGG